ncbi:helix-turn-helix domain-containing protein [Streptomyces sp. NPDC052396]|uniref:helix-turn-helix domain-containing protein n=1 Tax=Streptomyces sp. NPDC052396 TaxID=3365689 RepID=UPI0037CCC62F
MPPTIPLPAARCRRLGTELRRLRERAGLSAAEAGGRIGISPARLSDMEAGGQRLSAEQVRTLAGACGGADGPLVEALARMTGDQGHGWWEGYRDRVPSGLSDLAELEHHATALRVTQVVNIPGLLQTADCARAVFREAVPPLLPHEIEDRVSHRLKRQALLYRESSPPYTAIVHEAVLHMQFGGPRVARAQLEQLVALSERPGITVLVIPFRTGFPSTGLGVDFCRGPVPQLDTVVLDVACNAVVIDEPVRLNTYRLMLDRMQRVALDPEPSRDLVHRVAKAI